MARIAKSQRAIGGRLRFRSMETRNGCEVPLSTLRSRRLFESRTADAKEEGLYEVYFISLETISSLTLLSVQSSLVVEVD